MFKNKVLFSTLFPQFKCFNYAEFYEANHFEVIKCLGAIRRFETTPKVYYEIIMEGGPLVASGGFVDAQAHQIQYITEEDVKLILADYGYANNDTIIENYVVHHASDPDHMLGFLADYLKLQIHATVGNEKKILCCFVKAVCRANEAKAKMVKDMGLFDKEHLFYDVIKRKIEVPGLKPWSAKYITCLEDAVVFEDLSALQYKLRNRYNKFDKQHTQQALKTLARFHASTIIYEEKKSKELRLPYRITEEHAENFTEGGFVKDNPWFIQCKSAPLDAIKKFSKYGQNDDLMLTIEKYWSNVFDTALEVCDASNNEGRSVICHRDLWNNNILFHYSNLKDNDADPDDCVLVDFQAIHYQPPASDVMLLLHCNLSAQYRKDNLNTFLNFYYDELEAILWDNDINIQDIMTRNEFITSAKKQNQWGLVVYTCLVQAIWVDDELAGKLFGDAAKFTDFMIKDKSSYLKVLMQNNHRYKKAVMDVFEEVIEEYCLNQK